MLSYYESLSRMCAVHDWLTAHWHLCFVAPVCAEQLTHMTLSCKWCLMISTNSCAQQRALELCQTRQNNWTPVWVDWRGTGTWAATITSNNERDDISLLVWLHWNKIKIHHKLAAQMWALTLKSGFGTPRSWCACWSAAQTLSPVSQEGRY